MLSIRYHVHLPSNRTRESPMPFAFTSGPHYSISNQGGSGVPGQEFLFFVSRSLRKILKIRSSSHKTFARAISFLVIRIFKSSGQ